MQKQQQLSANMLAVVEVYSYAAVADMALLQSTDHKMKTWIAATFADDDIVSIVVVAVAFGVDDDDTMHRFAAAAAVVAKPIDEHAKTMLVGEHRQRQRPVNSS
jgi:hypothetical protein